MKAALSGIARRVWYRVGRRGCTLLFLALLDILVGSSFLSAPIAGASLVDFLLPYSTWGWVWIITGVICALCAVVNRDRVAFAAAAALKVGWGLANGYAWRVSHLPRGWVTTVVWLAFAALVLVIGSWPESPGILAGRAGVPLGTVTTVSEPDAADGGGLR